MTTRDCGCKHGFPLCACHEGRTGRDLLRRSNAVSAPTGWPSPNLDADVIAAHQAVVAAARAAQAATLKAAKPRVALGVDQSTIPPPDCVSCRERA